MDSDRLSAAFVELADSLAADFDVIDFLYLLTTRCTELLDVSAAGVLLVDPAGDLRVVAASNEQVRLLELFQLQNDQGPCLDCFRSGRQVNVTELSSAAPRWPQFVPQAQQHGFGAVTALPMRLREQVIGALNLFSPAPGLDGADIRIAQALADVATMAVLQHRAHLKADTVVVQLQTALNSRVLIEQAKGVLAERLGIDMDGAFSTLRRHARANNHKLSDLARAVIVGTDDLSTPRAIPAPHRRDRPHELCRSAGWEQAGQDLIVPVHPCLDRDADLDLHASVHFDDVVLPQRMLGGRLRRSRNQSNARAPVVAPCSRSTPVLVTLPK